MVSSRAIASTNAIGDFSCSVIPSKDGAAKKGGAVAAAAHGKQNGTGKAPEQRYFRIPFARPADRNRESFNEQTKKGWWYAHFEGRTQPIYQLSSVI
jgi:hypothetical protein